MTVKIMLTVFLFWLTAYGYGEAIDRYVHPTDRNSILLQYLTGVIAILALFTIVCIPVTIARIPFHILKYSGIAICVAGCILFFVDDIIRRDYKNVWSQIKFALGLLVRHWWSFIPLAFLSYQVIRTVIRTTSVYSDGKTYIPIVLDMLRTDVILGTDPVTGVVSQTAWMHTPKMVLSSWQQFLAVLCAMSGLHPLILIKTVMPIIIIPLHYLIIWELVCLLSKDHDKRILFLIFYALLMEFGSPSLRTDFSYYLFTWSWYGKTCYQFIIIPTVLLFFLMIQDHTTGLKDGLALAGLCIAGMGVSSTALMMLPIQFLVLIVLECISKKSVRELWISVPAFLPVAAGAALYFTMF